MYYLLEAITYIYIKYICIYFSLPDIRILMWIIGGTRKYKIKFTTWDRCRSDFYLILCLSKYETESVNVVKNVHVGGKRWTEVLMSDMIMLYEFVFVNLKPVGQNLF